MSARGRVMSMMVLMALGFILVVSCGDDDDAGSADSSSDNASVELPAEVDELLANYS